MSVHNVRYLCQLKTTSMKVIEYLKSTLRTAMAIFLALCALALVIGLSTAAYNHWERLQAKEYEVLKDWNADVRSHLDFAVNAKTKLVDGRLFMKVSTDAYPPYLRYLAASPSAQNAELILNFVDKDGFKIYSKSIPINSFSTYVDKSGKPLGLRFESEEYIAVKTYASLVDMHVQWTTDLVSLGKERSAAPVEKVLDHCAPNILKAERMKRLAQHGEVRQTGEASFEAGSHGLWFLSYDNSLINCR